MNTSFLLLSLLLLQLLAVSGDGYKHSHSDADHPFTRKEKFEGVTVNGAVKVLFLSFYKNYINQTLTF